MIMLAALFIVLFIIWAISKERKYTNQELHRSGNYDLCSNYPQCGEECEENFEARHRR